MKYLKVKDISNRLLYSQIENKQLRLKFMKIVLKQNHNNHKLVNFYLNSFNYSKLKTKILKRCPITNRNKTSYNKFGLSRTILNELFKHKMINIL